MLFLYFISKFNIIGITKFIVSKTKRLIFYTSYLKCSQDCIFVHNIYIIPNNKDQEFFLHHINSFFIVFLNEFIHTKIYHATNIVQLDSFYLIFTFVSRYCKLILIIRKIGINTCFFITYLISFFLFGFTIVQSFIIISNIKIQILSLYISILFYLKT